MGLPVAAPAAGQPPAAEQQGLPGSLPGYGGSAGDRPPSRAQSGSEGPQQPPQQAKSRRKRKTSAQVAAAPAGPPSGPRRVGVVWRDDGRQWEAAAMCATPGGQRIAVRTDAVGAAAKWHAQLRRACA